MSHDDDVVDGEIPYVELQVSNSAFGRRIREFDIINFGYKDIEPFLLNAFELYEPQIVEAITQFNIIKTLSYLIAEFEKAFVNANEHENLTFEKRSIYIPWIDA